MNAKFENVSLRCAEYVAKLRYEDIPRTAVTAALRSTLDWLGCTLGGSAEKPAEIARGYIEENGGPACATSLVDFKRYDAPNVAFVNGYCTHILEMDDIHKKATIHGAAPIISTAFALGEKLHRSGSEVLAAIVAGYEIALRVGEAVMPYHYTIWHSTGTGGTFGAAAAAASLYRLDVAKTLDALGQAGTQAAGLWEFNEDGAISKYLHCGKAAMNGVISAMTAARGLTGAKRILEGRRGFFKGYTNDGGKPEAFEGMGSHFKIEENAFKPHASCRHTHPMIDVALAMREEEGFDAERIESIEVHTYATALDIAGGSRFDTPMSARCSIPFCLACALVHGRVYVQTLLDPATREHPLIGKLVARTTLAVDPAIDREHPAKWPARVVVKTPGKTFSGFVEYPKGDPENPVSTAELEAKYMALATLRIQREAAEKLAQSCLTLASVKDLADFFRPLKD